MEPQAVEQYKVALNEKSPVVALAHLSKQRMDDSSEVQVLVELFEMRKRMGSGGRDELAGICDQMMLCIQGLCHSVEFIEAWKKACEESA